MLAIEPVLYLASLLLLAYILIRSLIYNTGNPDLVILKSLYRDQGDPIQCCFGNIGLDGSQNMGFQNPDHSDPNEQLAPNTHPSWEI